MFSLKDYQFDLPKDLIAENAAEPAHNARLMVINRGNGKLLQEGIFWDLDTVIPENRILFFNDSRVVRARILLKNAPIRNAQGESAEISEGEIFFLRKHSKNSFEALVRPGKKFKIGTTVFLGTYEFEVVSMTNEWRILEYHWGSLEEILETCGTLPLPPYIEYEEKKEKDYQTVFAKKDGSVAAPTASLHFTEDLMRKLPHEKQFLTLHVGLGTFQGIDTEDVRDYVIHDETAEVDKSLFTKIAREKSAWKKILAVGTTSCRTLESLPSLWAQLSESEQNAFEDDIVDFWHKNTRDLKNVSWVFDISEESASYTFKTRIYITPGYKFRVVDELITNFHLPASSLLVLVSALIGSESLSKIYAYAIAEKYRFFSLWDGMYIRESTL